MAREDLEEAAARVCEVAAAAGMTAEEAATALSAEWFVKALAEAWREALWMAALIGPPDRQRLAIELLKKERDG